MGCCSSSDAEEAEERLPLRSNVGGRAEACISIPAAVLMYTQDGEYVLYKVLYQGKNYQKRADRRYSEFRSLDKKMRELKCPGERCGLHRSAPLPPRMVTHWGNHNPSCITKRRLLLQRYLRSLSGLCNRHQALLERFLQENDGGALDYYYRDSEGFSGRKVERSHWGLSLPPQLRSYKSLQIQFGDQCLCTVADGGDNGQLVFMHMENTLMSRAAVGILHKLLTECMHTNSFPSAQRFYKAYKKKVRKGIDLPDDKPHDRKQAKRRSRFLRNMRSPLGPIYEELSPPFHALLDALWTPYDKSTKEPEEGEPYSPTSPSSSDDGKHDLFALLDKALASPERDILATILDDPKHSWAVDRTHQPSRSEIRELFRAIVAAVAPNPQKDLGSAPGTGKAIKLKSVTGTDTSITVAITTATPVEKGSELFAPESPTKTNGNSLKPPKVDRSEASWLTVQQRLKKIKKNRLKGQPRGD